MENFSLTFFRQYDTITTILKDESCRSFSKQFTRTAHQGLRPYGQPGPLPIGNLGCLID
ncbi:hypothetical protein SUBVAR_07310 [Subdoligranulum variabile DSM 15176]|uniref:Uncharacterized protein n=1 Tax=Subdoligranulum variabile DSM 15176 TaxID=411471 RepID=D1PSC7_9FIRM|nr:hypothetical protein SUBVAR_07310 [Subdoligranulum variabile DSM 15176]